MPRRDATRREAGNMRPHRWKGAGASRRVVWWRGRRRRRSAGSAVHLMNCKRRNHQLGRHEDSFLITPASTRAAVTNQQQHAARVCRVRACVRAGGRPEETGGNLNRNTWHSCCVSGYRYPHRHMRPIRQPAPRPPRHSPFALGLRLVSSHRFSRPANWALAPASSSSSSSHLLSSRPSSCPATASRWCPVLGGREDGRATPVACAAAAAPRRCLELSWGRIRRGGGGRRRPAGVVRSRMEGVQQLTAEKVISTRGGSVLGKKTILKSDHFPGCQNKRLRPHIDGAPNYRQAGSLRVHGVAMPTMRGIVNVLNHIGAQKKGKQTLVLWHSLREEPVIYINGRPFVLRDVERPFSNLEYTGINRERVEQMEFRLKEDILQEASRYGNKILVTDELPNGQMVDQWESVMSDTVKTPLEVYDKLQHQGYLVDYERVPITDEKAPKEGDFDNLVRRISQVDIETEIVFNCQMGRGRTTTGMVIATLLYLNRVGASGIPRTSSIGKVFHSGNDVDDYMPSSEEAILRGEYAVIRSLVRVLEGGVEGKRQVDKAIDKCDSMQNLREAIATYRNSILRQPDEMKREASLSFFVEYLERYYFLICFAVYVHSVFSAHQSTFSEEISFSDWMRARPELYSILRRLLRRDPMGALGYSSLKPPLAKIVESADGRPNEMDIVAAMRNGEVLGRQTVLKSDHCPGCQNLHLPERVDGAPNFREIPEFPVYGVANPTVDGIRAVIQRISTSKGGRPVMWHNMREEPVIYINGKPFVLREVERPYKNMLEYTGIDRDRVERMEARLKEDILREAERYSGAIMVIHETVNGLPIKYSRVPITDGKAPKSSDFDTIALNVTTACKDTAFVFNCQMGRGRTTTDRDEGYSSGDETTDNNGHLNLSSPRPHTVTEQHPRFGIDDIVVLRKITRLFDNGVECRHILDNVIDKCSALQNIRQAVLQYTKVIDQQHVEQRVKRVALNRGAEYLERYLKLVAFSAYLWNEAFDGFCGQGEAKMSFKAWIHQRPEIQRMKWSIRLRPGRFFTVNDESKASYQSPQGDVMTEAIVKSRNGSVLGKGSILKMHFFPGQRRSSSINFSGAPHVFKAPPYPLFSPAAGAAAAASMAGEPPPASTTFSFSSPASSSPFRGLGSATMAGSTSLSPGSAAGAARSGVAGLPPLGSIVGAAVSGVAGLPPQGFGLSPPCLDAGVADSAAASLPPAIFAAAPPRPDAGAAGSGAAGPPLAPRASTLSPPPRPWTGRGLAGSCCRRPRRPPPGPGGTALPSPRHGHGLAEPGWAAAPPPHRCGLRLAGP
ncbi:hypothetical protein GUJ93_ZPchr0013g36727 [Zizania palustris]|uniref:Paladin n=1 Tax=Zizania palustris TaxID=103762 RepID=A0A8J5X4Y5_ZIZPA|nr:hypothetical protein GUJ93_ZPchr0013g36727 [Zizania palustris]